MSITDHEQPEPLSRRMKLLTALLCLLVLGAGAALAAYFLATRPTPPQRPPVPLSPLVEAMPVRSGPEHIVIHAMGTVVPARETSIRAEVPGTVRQMSADFEPGGVVAAGKSLLRLETEDFQLAALTRKAALEQAKADLALERGYQEVARHEWEILSREGQATGSPDLALRKPQLAQARARLLQAEAGLAQAELDLRRTTVTAPFTALVLEKNVNLGAHVSTQETLGKLVDVSQYWVEASVPVDQLLWIALPGKDRPGSAADILAPDGSSRARGRVLRLLGDLENQGRMARILVSVPSPLDVRPTPVLLGEYVRLAIWGARLDSVIRLPRAALHDGDTVWTVRDGLLDIRQVTVAWRDHESVLVSGGLSSGDMVVTSDIPAPIAGMSVTLSGQSPSEP